MKQKAIRLLVPFLLLALLVGCQGTEQTKTERSIDTLRSFKHFNVDMKSAETESTIYFIAFNSPYIMYVDKATGISGPLCAKPECMHNDETCNAYVSGTTGGLFTADDRLYWVSLTPDSTFNVPVYGLALDGTGLLETIYLDGKLIPSTIQSPYCILHDDTLFISMIAFEAENGAEAAYYYICAFPLHAKEEPTVILREKANSGMSIVLQYYNGYLYILTDDSHKTSEGTVEEAERTRLYDLRLRRWNEASGEMETLYEEIGSPLQEAVELWATDDGVYFNRYQGTKEARIYFYSFADDACELICTTDMEGSLAGIGDDLLAGCTTTEGQEGMYDLTVGIKNFAGDVLLQDTYSLDLSELAPFSGRFQFIGRDEAYAYYAAVKNDDIYDEAEKFQGQNIYTAIVSVALNGLGARVLCINKSAHMVERY